MQLSFEFFPPKDEVSLEKLQATAMALAKYQPELFTVTFGAGGSSQEKTVATVAALKQQLSQPVAAHLSCIGMTRARIDALLVQYQQLGVTHLIALRGDMPSGMVNNGDFRYAAELVAYIREQTGDTFTIIVGAYPEYHPQAESALADLQHFAEKAKAGADYAFTQYFYNPDSYAHFVEQVTKLGVDLPIIPGIMPIYNFTQLARFSDTCGAEIPRWIRRKLQAYGDDKAAVQAFGIDVVTKLCQRLLALDVPGLHFYTLNQKRIIEQLLADL